MNQNIYNQNEIKNKLQNFQEGKDYFVTPSKEPKLADYTFFNDNLKSLFGGNNWVPVRVWQEKYEDKNVSYRGHFEEGKNYYYSAQCWDYNKGENASRETQNFHYPKPLLNDLKKWKEAGFRNIKLHSEGGKFEGGKMIKHWESRENWYKNEPLHYLPHTDVSFNEGYRLVELKTKHNSLMAKLNSLFLKSESEFGVNGKEKKEFEIAQVKEDIATIEREIKEEKVKSDSDEYYRREPQQRGRMEREGKPAGCCLCGFRDMGPSDKYCQNCGAELCEKAKSGKVDLEKENYELRQQLAQVQAELAKVLAELKKLTGKNEVWGKLEQQQAQNEKTMKEGSTTQIKEQVAKSQALVQEVSSQNTVASNEPKNSVLPYVVGGSLLVAGIGGVAIWLKKRSRK
ncbi:MAG: hypothetical protein I3273_02095 [Candidatus Moeniiplasma glomeromycotorum]|nr:hypothetical protein [Candidatus Moeniiplasma glomeromycotorum]MCE8167089.1 hypothetical protein [Candidatus Moeniiplasma glomeromycotorum]MCE8168899.1 hypothetical protein [Candidatus Moeniiplasma glomeromycotorum]